MALLKKKNFWLLILIISLGIILRLIFINKPDGLWNDEYVSWFISSIPYGKSFWNAVFAQCHMPFYYLYLKLFIHFLGNSDLMLRLTSVLPGILSIISMFFVGRELKGNKLGLLCAFIASISSFLIYFSQEVRFYGLLFLFSSLSLIFTLRLIKKQNISNLIFYILSNFLIIFTHTIGFIFVFFNLIYLSYCLNKTEKYKKTILISWLTLFFLTLINLPLLFKIVSSHSIAQFWGNFTFSKLGFLITDYFSPILTNIVSSPDNFFYHFTFGFILFALIPSIIAITGIIKTLQQKDYKKTGLFLICIGYIFILILLSVFKQIVFITKYSIEIYPILIAIMAYGLQEFKQKMQVILISLFCFLNLFYVLVDSNSAPKMHRSEGHKIVAELIKQAELKDGDYILLTYYPQNRFEKYFNFDNYKVISINKNTYPKFLGIKTKEEFKNIDSKYFDNEFNKRILSQIKPNQKIAIVILKDISVYSPIQMETLMNNQKEYKKAPFFFLVFSQVKNELLKNCLSNLRILRLEEKGSWSVITFSGK